MISVVILVVLRILLVTYNIYKVSPKHISLVYTLIGTCTKCMLGNLDSALVRFDHIILINEFEYGVSTTYDLTLPVIQLMMCVLT